MTAAALLALWAVLVTAALPPLLAGARWTRRSPVLGVLTWQTLGLSAVLSVSMAIRQLVDPSPHHHGGLLHLCGVSPEAVSGTALAVAALTAARPAALLLRALHTARRERRRHRAVLDLAAHRGRVPGGALLLDHPTPAVYCLPGRHSRIVVSRGALTALSPEQLAAALAHERAHLTGRHHLAVCAARALAGTFGRLPLGRLVEAEVRTLLEMAADDRALRRHSPRALATAMGVVAGAHAPASALTAGHQALARIERLATTRPASRPALALAATAPAALLLLPLLLVCLPHLA
ncbi:M56 family metallopeptidase [Kitasatospora sp. NPDC096147]|uniref:M56 family metallopeptidase n=1 Tax=Kitasatospora sp. NPDC096147 TaxID=3364093 RepID=UPI0037FCB927